MPLPKKVSQYAPDIKHFKKAYLPSFPGLDVFVLVNIQPNSNYIPPSKFSGSAPGDENSFRKDEKLTGHRTITQQKMGHERKKVENHWSRLYCID